MPEKKKVEAPEPVMAEKEALQLARTVLNLPEELQVEHSNYYTGGFDGNGMWFFQLKGPKGEQDYSMSVEVDAVNGWIRYFYRWKPGYYSQDQASVISESEALDRALEFI